MRLALVLLGVPALFLIAAALVFALADRERRTMRKWRRR